MGYRKNSVNLFLEKTELNKEKDFIDSLGWRKFLLANSLKFGLIKEQYFDDELNNAFTNGQITQGSSLSLDYAAIFGIDSNGDFIISDAGNLDSIADSAWYWLKIKYTTSNLEKGTVSIDVNGNLTGVGTDFLSSLRGQPNFPTRISFPDSSLNTLEYDVLEVISDTVAVLDNQTFVNESTIKYSIIGTFTPACIPTENDKNIFVYDSCEISLVAETVFNTKPTYVEGEEFFLARVKSTGSVLTIQDKRTDIWKTKADFFSQNIKTSFIPLFGVEKLKYDSAISTLDSNIVYFGFTFRSSNYTVNSNLNILSIIGGRGGKFKSVLNFTDGDFDGWRVYTSEGTYSTIKSSVKVGGQINLYLDFLNIDDYSSDGGATFTNEEVIITPDCEEIEIICRAEDSNNSESGITGDLTTIKKTFPINTDLAKIELFVYTITANQCKYAISYRLKHTDVYSQEFDMIADTAFGYYTEKAFDEFGNLLNIVQSNNHATNLASGYIAIYSTNEIVLASNPLSYGNTLNLGDLPGIENRNMFGNEPVYHLIVGQNRNYQVITNTSNLGQNNFIDLNKININGDNCRNGNKFTLYFIGIKPNDFDVKIVTDYVDINNNTELYVLTDQDVQMTNVEGTQMFILDCIYDGDNTWTVIKQTYNVMDSYDGWTALTLESGWSHGDFDTYTFGTASYNSEIPNNTYLTKKVTLKGVIKNLSGLNASSYICTIGHELPVGIRPLEVKCFFCSVKTTAGTLVEAKIIIDAGGQIQFDPTTITGWSGYVSLDGISYYI